MEKKAAVLEEFEKLSAVPRRSYHNEKIVAYCIRWAEENGFDYTYDDINGNVVIRKPAAPGKEDHPGVILQGHLDMVAESDPDVLHDWENEGIEILVDGDYYTANGTTLGADDGVAPATAFAILKDKTLNNPPLEVLLTTNEEVGMDSVKDADLTFLKGKYLLNIDSAGESSFTIGCCGGKVLKAIVPDKREACDGKAYNITIGGLTGGHSGIEITNEKANAIKLMGKILYDLGKVTEYRISSLGADGKDNAISNNCTCDIVTKADTETVEKTVAECEAKIRHMYRMTDPDITITVSETEAEDALCEKESRTLAFLMHVLPYGPHHLEQNLTTIETSNNIGPIENENDGIGIVMSIRSSVEERKQYIYEQICDLCSMCGVVVEDQNKSYPAWLPNFDSEFLALLCDIYEEMYGIRPAAATTHGGLECGYIMAHSNIEDAVAIGPDITGEHTTQERVSISSMVRIFDFVRTVLERL